MTWARGRYRYVIGGWGLLILSTLVFSEVSALAAHKKKSKVLYHKVNSDFRTLGEVSLFLYSKVQRFKDIARWNHLRPPYKISVGQKLRLKDPPILQPEEGRKLLVQMWQRLCSGGPASKIPTLKSSPEVQKKNETGV